MARWKVTLYLTDECAEHSDPKGCETNPDWCYRAVPEGELETEKDAQSWASVLLTYGDKHQDASFTGRVIERVESPSHED